MADLEQQLKNYRLTTAEILYHMPDFPDFLQTYVWQDYDIAPKFPVLKGFIGFWHRELDGRIHSVQMDSNEIITPSDNRFFDFELTIQ